MRKLVISAIAAASLIGAISAANAGWFDAYGFYHDCFVGPYGVYCF
jgi:hypothetical protein